MRISITGSHCTGKTTLAEAVEYHLGIPFVKGDTMKEILNSNFPGRNFEDLLPKEAWRLENLGLNNRISVQTGKENFVSDGCTLNSIAYAIAECGDDVKKRPDFHQFESRALTYARTYDIMVYLPLEIPFRPKGVIPPSKEFREEIDRLILELLHNFQFYTLNGTVEQRVEKLRKIIIS